MSALVRCLTVVCALALAATAHAYPGEYAVLAEKAREAYNRGDFTEAMRLYGEALRDRPNDARLKLNMGTAQLKHEEPDKALESFSGVYDETDATLGARARYNAGVLRHNRAREAVRGMAEAQDADARRKARETAIATLKETLGEYQSAIISGQGHLDESLLNDMRFNHELAQRELDELLRQPPESPSQQNQQQDDQQDDQQQSQQGQQGQQDQQPQNQNQDQSGQQKNQDQQQQDKQEQAESGQQDEQSQDQQQQAGQSERKEGEQEQGKPEEGKNGQPQPTPPPTPTPGPTATPPPGATPPPTGQPQNAGNPGNQSAEPPPEMTPDDVERLLNSLPDNDQKCLQRFYGNNPRPDRQMEKDW